MNHQCIFGSSNPLHTCIMKQKYYHYFHLLRKHWQNLRICKIEVGFEKFVFHTQHTHLVQAYHVCGATKWKEEIVYFTFFQARKHVRLSLFPLGIHNGMFQNANLPFLDIKSLFTYGIFYSKSVCARLENH